MNGFMIAAPQSGSGKTTVALAIMAAFRRRGLKVAPFKCGPDFIDPGYHRLASGRISINLDAWICPPPFVRDTFAFHSFGADVAVIEGVMGLFDGLGSSREGSSAEVAQLSGAPVVLVVNARGMAASAAAVVKGFAGFDEQVKIAGVIFNNVGSVAHGEMLRQAIAGSLPEIAVFGCILRDDSLAIPSRHLGLVTVEDNPLSREYLEQLADMAERSLDLDRLAGVGLTLPPFPHPNLPFMPQRELEEEGTKSKACRIAVARDAAFCFVYEDNLRLLRNAGATVIEFSPLEDARLPEGISGIYLPGGYPELYAVRLASNVSMIHALRDAAESDVPVYAECGGFIYLTEGMEASGETAAADFVGVFPVRARMLPKRKALGYRQAELLSATGVSGMLLRGHEFHYSEIGAMPENIERCYRVSRNGKELGLEGYRIKNCLGSYLHLHLGSNPVAAAAFVQACSAEKQA